MAEKVLTDSKVLEIVYNSDESFSDSSTDSVGSSDNEIDDIAVADTIMNDEKRKYPMFNGTPPERT